MSYTKKAAAFGKLVGICAGYEGKYNPARQNLTITAIRKLATEAEAANLSVIVARKTWTTASGNRKMAFTELEQLVKRLRGEIKNLSIDQSTSRLMKVALNKAAAYNNGVNSDPPSDANEPAASKTKRGHSVDYATRLAAFDEVIHALATIPEYKSPLPDLSVKVLKSKSAELKNAMNSVNLAAAELSTIRSHRRNIFDNPVSGVSVIAAGIKNVVKATFGNPSSELKNVQSAFR
ncbi:MAG: hypothetical protein ACO263_09870 [Cyclobacteriaceae bacterium]|jgi:hypothetical protein